MKPARLLAGVLATALAIALLLYGASIHIMRACALRDTPYLQLCDGMSGASDGQRAAGLRDRLHRNPGDAQAWIELTSVEKGGREQALLRAASTLAPNEPNVLMWRAGQALRNNDLAQATDLLVQIVRYHRGLEAAQALAHLLASGQVTELLRAHLLSADQWLPEVLQGLAALRLPFSYALPLLAQASKMGKVPPEILRSYIRTLKAQGNWTDAYGLWVSQQKGPTSLLYNGSFDQAFQPDGFDWEVTPAGAVRPGALVDRRRVSGNAHILEIRYTGRAVPDPVIRQYLYLPPGRYVLSGQFKGSKLRMEQGLAWAARCPGKAAKALAGRSDALQDTGGKWRSFQFSFTAGPDCGLVTSLQLETFAPYEAAAGFEGRASFDALELRRADL